MVWWSKSEDGQNRHTVMFLLKNEVWCWQTTKGVCSAHRHWLLFSVCGSARFSDVTRIQKRRDFNIIIWAPHQSQVLHNGNYIALFSAPEQTHCVCVYVYVGMFCTNVSLEQCLQPTYFFEQTLAFYYSIINILCFLFFIHLKKKNLGWESCMKKYWFPVFFAYKHYIYTLCVYMRKFNINMQKSKNIQTHKRHQVCMQYFRFYY